MSTAKRSPARLGIEERKTAKGATQYRARVFDKAAGRQLRSPWTSTLAEARAWRVDALAALQAGTLSADRGVTVREVTMMFLAGIESGAIRTRSGQAHKPSTIRGYRRDLTNRVMPAFGAARLTEVTLPDVQRWADTLSAEGLSPSTVRNVVTAMRALYAWALPRGLARVNPTAGLRLPTGSTARERIAAPREATALIAALAPRDQAALGLAVYAGLRLGELLALDWENVDLDAGTLRVVRAWDHGSRTFVAPKSKAGTRTVPIIARLSLLLADHRVLTDHRPGLLFAGRTGQPAAHSGLRDRMTAAWRRNGLEPLGFHEGRHTFASLMIGAGVNAKALSAYLGHSSVAITFDRYGHLFPGAEHEARGLLDAYMAREGE